MNKRLILLLILNGLPAQAKYTVGDSVRYSVEINSFVNFKYDLLSKIMAVDQINKKLTIKKSYFESTGTKHEIENSSFSKIKKEELKFDRCMQMPASDHPRYETLVLPSGTFATCHYSFTDDDGAMYDGYYSKILFGMVKILKRNSAGKTIFNVELKEIKTATQL